MTIIRRAGDRVPVAAFLRGEAVRSGGVALFILGGLLVLQGSDHLDAPKWLYLALTAVVVLFATGRLVLERASIRAEPLALAWLLVAATFGALIVVSLPIAVANGTPLTQWLRDAAPYALFAVAPIMAVDSRDVPRRFHVSLLVVGGLLAATSFAIEWIARRNIADLPLDRLVLPTGLLASTLLAYATGRAMIDRRWLLWAATGGLVLALFFVTGTRSTLLLLLVPIVLAVVANAGVRHSARVIASQLLVTVAVMAVILTVLLRPLDLVPTPGQIGASAAPVTSSAPMTSSAPVTSSGPAATRRPDVIGERVESIGSVLSNPWSDASFGERIAQTRAAWDVFARHPLAGTGPGTMIDWTSATRGAQSSFSLDTPLIYVAKFGLLGLAGLAVLLVVFGHTVRVTARAGRKSAGFLAITGLGLVVAIAGLLNSPFEDKGLSFALVLILGLALTAADSTGSLPGDSKRSRPASTPSEA